MSFKVLGHTPLGHLYHHAILACIRFLEQDDGYTKGSNGKGYRCTKNEAMDAMFYLGHYCTAPVKFTSQSLPEVHITELRAAAYKYLKAVAEKNDVINTLVITDQTSLITYATAVKYFHNQLTIDALALLKDQYNDIILQDLAVMYREKMLDYLKEMFKRTTP
jgi:hypothetical protein